MNIKEEIAKVLPDKLKTLVSESTDISKGDYSVACFALAKEYKKSPVVIAQEIASSINGNELFSKVEAVNGYVNFFLNKSYVTKLVLSEFAIKNTQMFKSNSGNGKVICIDYSSVNLAKYMHIGHLCTTLIGESLARIFETCGYKVIRMNYVGDFGTPFGKMICGYKLWGSKEDVERRGVDAIQEYYVKFCKHEDDETYAQMARDTFTKLEHKDPEIMEIYKWFIDVTIDETKHLCSVMGANFDDWRGESYYSEKIPEFTKELNKYNLLEDGENGAKIIDLTPYDLGIVVYLKKDGSSLYVTRDLATACGRFKEYKFDKCLYVTDTSQKLHFKQFFKILDIMGKPFAKNLVHVSYGRFSLPEGKISSRLGKQALLKDILNEAITKAKEVISDRNLENAEDVALKVGIGATAFSVLKKDKSKDSVFDINTALNFDGETSPYMQYTYARCASLVRKSGLNNIDYSKIDFSYLNNEESFELIKIINNFSSTIEEALNNYEPSVISKKVMELCKLVNVFYHKQKVVTDNDIETLSKIALIDACKQTIKFALNLICIDTVEQM